MFLYLAWSSWFPSLGTHHCNECHSSSVLRQGLEPRVLIIHCLFFHVVQHPRYPQGTISKISGQWQLPWNVYGLSKWFKGTRKKRPQGRRPLFEQKQKGLAAVVVYFPHPLLDTPHAFPAYYFLPSETQTHRKRKLEPGNGGLEQLSFSCSCPLHLAPFPSSFLPALVLFSSPLPSFFPFLYLFCPP